MFTGIITEIGTLVALDQKGDWILTIQAPQTARNADLGASIACSGTCLTVIGKTAETFTVQVSAETLSKTTLGQWAVGRRLNLERALKAGDELGGHFVSGHVDGVAEVVSREPEQDSLRFRFRIPDAFSSFIAPKGSVALDGISLTVNEVEGSIFGINIIPFTQEHTTMGATQPGDKLNFEIDPIARYVARWLGKC